MTAPAQLNQAWTNGQTVQASDFNTVTTAVNQLSDFFDLAFLTSEINLSNSTTVTTILTSTLPTGSLAAGSTFRFKCYGTIQFASSSNTLTFTPSLAGTVSTMTPQMANQGSSGGPYVFDLEIIFQVRTTGGAGTYMAYGKGAIAGSSSIPILPSTTPATATINTAVATPVLLVQAQWALASSSNILKIETATLERVA